MFVLWVMVITFVFRMLDGGRARHHPGAARAAALRLFKALVEEHEKGSDFFLKRPDGEVVQYKIFL